MFDLNGKWIPQGRVAREAVKWDAWDTIPSTMTIASGTGTSSLPNAGFGQFALTTGTNSGNAAELEATAGTASIIETEYVEELKLDVNGLYLSADENIELEIGMHNDGITEGFRFVQVYNSEQVKLQQPDGAGAWEDVEAIPHSFHNGGTSGSAEGQNHRNLTIIYRPILGKVYLFSDGSLIYEGSVTALASGQVWPRIKVTTRTAAARSAYFMQLVFTVYHN